MLVYINDHDLKSAAMSGIVGSGNKLLWENTYLVKEPPHARKTALL